MLSSLPGYFYSTSGEGIWVHLYARGKAAIALPSGRVRIDVETAYPWDGEVRLAVEAESPEPFSLFLRIPDWCRGATIAVNDATAEAAPPGAYFEVRRSWEYGDVVKLNLPMPVRLLQSHPRLLANHGRVAIARGPLIYCLEGVDHSDTDVWDVAIPADAQWDCSFDPDLLGGITVLKTDGGTQDRNRRERSLYREFRSTGTPPAPVPSTVPVKAIPYYAWANRDPGPMQVWIPVIDA